MCPTLRMFLLLTILETLINTYSFMLPCDFDKRCLCGSNDGLPAVNCSRANINISIISKCPPNVSILDLSHNTLIEEIPNGTFKNMTNLVTLNISFNFYLERLESDSFLGLMHLKYLRLSDTGLYYDTYPRDVLYPLISLCHLDVRFINGGSFNFRDDIISSVTRLTYLAVDTYSNGKLFGKGFSALKFLKKFKAGKCSLKLNNETFRYMPYLESVEISSCAVAWYFPCTFCGRNLKLLDMSSNLLNKESLSNFMFDLNTFSVERLILKNAFDLQPSIFPFFFIDFLRKDGHGGTKYLDLSYNNFNELKRIQTVERIPETLKYIDFSNNRLSQVLILPTCVDVLNLGHNELGLFLASNSYTEGRKNYLKELNFAFNMIRELQPNIFENHISLQKLNLSNNFLFDINFNLSFIMTLKMLDLSNNNITQVRNKHAIETLTVMMKTSDLEINLSNNPLICSCKTLRFLQWIDEHLEHFKNSKTYRCRFKNNSVEVLTDLKWTVKELKKDCASYIALINIISMAIITTCIFLSVGLFYRYRWKLRYIYYMTKSKNRKRVSTSSDSYTYDAFISYADTDKDFVVNDCILNLEQNGGMKLCIHQRDFLPGKEITVNIINGIHESRRIICVITRSFLESYFCMFEFNMARMESFYSRSDQNILFLVFYEQIYPRELPLVMLELVQTQSYIEYPNDDQGNIVFWEKIKEAVG